MDETSKGTETVMLNAPTGSSFMLRSTRSGPLGPIRSIGGRRTICGR